VTSFNHLIRIADRLGEVTAGSSAADLTIHLAIEREGHVLSYTSHEGAAWGLLPPSFEWIPSTYAGHRVYAACRRSGLDGEWPHPHYGQWGRTLPLAMCGAVIRAYATLAKG
jgi:hypothetical protein